MSKDAIVSSPPSNTVDFSNKHGLVDLWSLPFSRQETEETFPVASPDPPIQHRSMREVVRNSVTRSGEKPYEDANISLRIFDPEEIADQIRPITTYLDSNRLESLYYQDISLRSLGIDLFKLDNVAIYKDDSTGNKYIGPPVVEKNEDGTFSVVDGHHRLYFSMLFKIPTNIVIVDNFDIEHRNPYQALDWKSVNPTSSVPADLNKHLLLPGHSELDLVEMSLAGDQGSRKKGLPKEAPFFHTSPLIKSRKLGRWAAQVMGQMEIEPLFPVIFKDRTPISEVTAIADTAISLDSVHFMPTITISHTQGRHQGKEMVFRPFAEKRGASKNRARLVVISDSVKEYGEKLQQNRVTNEVHISSQIRQQINIALSENNMHQISEQDSLDQSKDSPHVTGFRVVNDNPYFSVLILDCKDNDTMAFKINRRNTYQGRQVEGTIFMIRNQEDELILLNQWRELFGMHFLEAPRMFGYTPIEFAEETGILINTDEVNANISLVCENREIDTVSTQILSARLSNKPALGQGNMTATNLSDKDCHQLIANGQLHCEYTASAITIDQLINQKLIINPLIDSKKLHVVLEKYYNPLENKYYFRPPRVKTGTGMRVGQNSFPDTGACLDYNHTEVGDVESLPAGKYYQGVPVSEIVDMILAGQLDSTATAHISRIFRAQEILVLKNNSQ